MEKSTEKSISYAASGNSINSKVKYPLRSALRSKEGKPHVPNFLGSSVPRSHDKTPETQGRVLVHRVQSAASGKGKHKPTCTFTVCEAVKRRFKTLMMRKRNRGDAG